MGGSRGGSPWRHRPREWTVNPGHIGTPVHVDILGVGRTVHGGTSVPTLSVSNCSTTVIDGHFGPPVSVHLLNYGRCVHGGNFVLDVPPPVRPRLTSRNHPGARSSKTERSWRGRRVGIPGLPVLSGSRRTDWVPPVTLGPRAESVVQCGGRGRKKYSVQLSPKWFAHPYPTNFIYSLFGLWQDHCALH